MTLTKSETKTIINIDGDTLATEVHTMASVTDSDTGNVSPDNTTETFALGADVSTQSPLVQAVAATLVAYRAANP